MRVFSGDGVVTDRWQLMAAGAPWPAGGAVIVPLAELPRALAGERDIGDVGVLLSGDDDIDGHADMLSRLPLIAIDFPRFTDGRGYSLAHVLRRRGYDGDLRAVGEVLRDQVFFLCRCGFTSFALGDDAHATDFRRGFEGFSDVYQPAADGRRTVGALRADTSRAGT